MTPPRNNLASVSAPHLSNDASGELVRIRRGVRRHNQAVWISAALVLLLPAAGIAALMTINGHPSGPFEPGGCRGKQTLSTFVPAASSVTPAAAAATWAASHPEAPRTGWVETGRDGSGTVLRSGRASLHAIPSGA